MLALYSLTLFLSAVLLFSVEPMVGKMILPRCGGTPAVWNTCMVFFQAVLLVSYGYAHVSTKWLGVRRQAVLHSIVVWLPLLALPVAFAAGSNPPADKNPSFWLLGQLALAVGLPFFVISTTAPLLQKWFAGTGHAASRDPYFLYSTSNAGSLLALLAYPFVVEPRIGLLAQTKVWHVGYGILAALVLLCAIALWLSSRKTATAEIPGEKSEEENKPAPTFGQRIRWVFLAFVPSSLMLGVTTHISTDIASVPLLWVIPLAIYLLTFILVFARRPLVPHSAMVVAMAFAVLIMPLMSLGAFTKFWIVIPLHLLTFFIIAMVCHGEMARTRPCTSHLTEFYFLMSLGGVLGGMFNSLAAPLIFSSTQWFGSIVEYPMMIVAAAFLMPGQQDAEKRRAFDLKDYVWLIGLIVVAGAGVGLAFLFDSFAWKDAVLKRTLVLGLLYGLPAILCFSFKGRPIRFALGAAFLFLATDYYSLANKGNLLLVERNFFGVNRVRVEDQRFHVLVNGDTIHGLQIMYPKPSTEPMGYYCRSGPLGDIFEAFSGPMLKRRVGVIGLGSGGMAAYAKAGQNFTFYDIDPVVVELASDPNLFTYLRDCQAKYDLVLGDARLRLAESADGQFDMIVLDAFSSDSIPIHLLTEEALDLYLAKSKSDGVLVLHISNRYLELEPMLARLAAKKGLFCMSRLDDKVSTEDIENGKRASHYVVMARRESDLGPLAENKKWSSPATSEKVRVWTDDYSDILNVLNW
jgi:hypothetical protein